MATMSYGIAFGWCSPSLPALLSDESPLPTGPITIDESNWISSILCIGLTLGALLSGPLSGRLGRIRLLMVLVPIQSVGWLLVIFAQNVYYLYGSRLLLGFIGSVLFVVLPVYVAEIADDRCVCISKQNLTSSMLISVYLWFGSISQYSRFIGLYIIAYLQFRNIPSVPNRRHLTFYDSAIHWIGI